MYDFASKQQEQSTEGVMAAFAQAMAPALAKQLGIDYKVAASGTPSTPYLHGPGGLFGVAGIERDLIHTRIRGNGLASMLPVLPVTTTNPFFGYISGFNDVSGDVANGVCDDPQLAGSMKTCLQTAAFGRYGFRTREVEITRIGELINRGEFDDLRLLNDPIAPMLGESVFPDLNGRSQLSAGAEVLARWLELGVAFVNLLGRQTYTGNPANNSAGGGYMEFPGLDILIGVTKVDAITGQDCPSLDSDVKNFNYERVDNADADPSIVRVLTTMWRFVNHIASQTGLNPVQFAFTMRTALFWELTDVWACDYLTYRCQVSDAAGERVVIDGREQVRLRDEMRNGNFLLVDGQRIPVILDDFILEESSDDTNQINVGCFASDIYLVPLTILGGTPATFFQHFDFREGTMRAVVDGRVTSKYWTDNGRYMWSWDNNNWCLVWEALTKPRLILRTPQIAGRLQNVSYCPLQHPRDVHPDDDYFVDGGVTDRAAPSLFSDWNSS